ncbi:TIR domain-containing protein [Mesorhizobium australicum]|uniref:toll/interleukin-1 receptor domain-containing protein n=1 Tax=Mesorhizobium australicum TaxID=536018 RepID=UPI00333C5F2D
MTKVNAPTQIFLSHAAVDKPLVEAFEMLLARSMGLTAASIFCSSLEGQGVRKGVNFVDAIRAKVVGAKAVVALITPAYLDSAFCMAELGAAWALKTQRLPIVVPPNTFKIMEATLLGITGVKIDNQDALSQAFEELAESIEGTAATAGVRARAMREFQRAWDTLKDNVPSSTRIEASVHSETIRERDAALEARDDAEEELSKAEAKIAALRKVKNAAEVAMIDEDFDESSWEERLDNALDEIRELFSELGGKEIVRLLILDHFGKFVRPDMHEHGDEAGRAIELDVYDDEGVKWNYGHADVIALVKLVDEVVEIFDENLEAGAAFKARKQKSDPRNIRFWEEHL